MKQLLFIINPNSGKGRVKPHLSDIVELFNRNGYEVCVHMTKAPLDAYETVINTGKRYNRIVCSGGDGTVDEVFAGMIDGNVNVPLGYIPAGTTNDFARNVGIPKKVMKAAEVAISGKTFAYDVGRFNRKPFAYVAAFGVFSDVAYDTPSEMKKALGYLAYVMSGFRSFWSMKSYEMEVEIDGKIVRDRFIYGQISNATHVGGIKTITSETTKFDDGKFEVMLVRQPKDVNDFRNLLGALMLQNVEPRHMVYARTSDVKIRSKRSVVWTLDGENGGEHKNVHITQMKRAIRIIRPAEFYNEDTALKRYDMAGLKMLLPPYKGKLKDAVLPYRARTDWDEEEADIIIPDLDTKVRKMMKVKGWPYSKCEFKLTVKMAGAEAFRFDAASLEVNVSLGEDGAVIFDKNIPAEEISKVVSGDIHTGRDTFVRIIDGEAFVFPMPLGAMDEADRLAKYPVKAMIVNPDNYVAGAKLSNEESIAKIKEAIATNYLRGFEKQCEEFAEKLSNCIEVF